MPRQGLPPRPSPSHTPEQASARQPSSSHDDALSAEPSSPEIQPYPATGSGSHAAASDALGGADIRAAQHTLVAAGAASSTALAAEAAALARSEGSETPAGEEHSPPVGADGDDDGGAALTGRAQHLSQLAAPMPDSGEAEGSDDAAGDSDRDEAHGRMPGPRQARAVAEGSEADASVPVATQVSTGSDGLSVHVDGDAKEGSMQLVSNLQQSMRDDYVPVGPRPSSPALLAHAGLPGLSQMPRDHLSLPHVHSLAKRREYCGCRAQWLSLIHI